MDTIQKLKWNVLPHLPNSPVLATSDYHLFIFLNEHLSGKMFRNNEEVVQNVQEWLQWQSKDFFLSSIRKFPACLCKCNANQEDYVENKQFKFRRINQSFVLFTNYNSYFPNLHSCHTVQLAITHTV